jgi:hypothetical protein
MPLCSEPAAPRLRMAAGSGSRLEFAADPRLAVLARRLRGAASGRVPEARLVANAG